jgi:hypothetical protein
VEEALAELFMVMDEWSEAKERPALVRKSA